MTPKEALFFLDVIENTIKLMEHQFWASSNIELSLFRTGCAIGFLKEDIKKVANEPDK